MTHDDRHGGTVTRRPTAGIDDRARQDGTGAASSPPRQYCSFCGVDTGESGSATERFGQPFCSEAHAEEFVKGVRAARAQAAVSSIEEARSPAVTNAEDPADARPRTWGDRLKRWGCWVAPLGLLLALPLLNQGGTIAGAAGSLLSVVALLACPLAMYFMMRSMGNMNQRDGMQHGKSAESGGKDHASGERGK